MAFVLSLIITQHDPYHILVGNVRLFKLDKNMRKYLNTAEKVFVMQNCKSLIEKRSNNQ